MLLDTKRGCCCHICTRKSRIVSIYGWLSAVTLTICWKLQHMSRSGFLSKGKKNGRWTYGRRVKIYCRKATHPTFKNISQWPMALCPSQEWKNQRTSSLAHWMWVSGAAKPTNPNAHPKKIIINFCKRKVAMRKKKHLPEFYFILLNPNHAEIHQSEYDKMHNIPEG